MTSTPQGDFLTQIDRELSAMTGPSAGPPRLWRAALDASAPAGAAHSGGLWRRFASRPIGGPLMLAAALLFCVLLTGLLLPALGKARMSVRRPAESGAVAGFAPLGDYRKEAADSPAPSSQPVDSVREIDGRSVGSADAGQAAPVRMVVRKATIDLAVTDVRAAFAKAQHLVSEVGGEFIEDSTLTGEGERAQANLTLRVRADRLGKVLAELGALGLVVQESSRGEDVTDQAVDLDARIRNDQRVETELLDLLSKRSGAPLADVLQLRNSIASIRENIERLTAQRDRISRQVSLSSVLVIIRHESTAGSKAVSGTGIGAYFGETIASAWRASLRFLADTLGFLVAVIVGGIIWWVLLAGVAIVLFRLRRRTLSALADEPAPRLD